VIIYIISPHFYSYNNLIKVRTIFYPHVTDKKNELVVQSYIVSGRIIAKNLELHIPVKTDTQESKTISMDSVRLCC
jgi:hypothetical protein